MALGGGSSSSGELGFYQHTDIGVETCILSRVLVGKREQQPSNNEGSYILGVMGGGKGILGVGGLNPNMQGTSAANI